MSTIVIQRSPSVIRPQEMPATGALIGHAGVHQGQGGAADRALGGGAVGGKHLRNEPHGVGELLHRGEHRDSSARLRQGAVADLPAAGAAGRAGLADRVGGEVVLMHIALFGPPRRCRRGSGRSRNWPEGGDGQHLGLAAGKQAGAMDAGQQTHFGGRVDGSRPCRGRRHASARQAASGGR